jgi:putative glutamine amidotransferase
MNPARAGFELTLIQKAVSKNLPVLGICGGHQALNVALGGTLVQDIGRDIQKALSHRESRHAIEILPGTRLYEILGRKRLMVNSYHHQAPRDPARGLRINARTSDGVIEGLEGTNGGFLLGVQWHPEYLDSPFNRRLFSAFIKETRG